MLSIAGEQRIHLTFNDGLEVTIDFGVCGPAFEPPRDPGFFPCFFLDGGTMAWPNGADIAPETLYGRAKASAAAHSVSVLCEKGTLRSKPSIVASPVRMTAGARYEASIPEGLTAYRGTRSVIRFKLG